MKKFFATITAVVLAASVLTLAACADKPTEPMPATVASLQIGGAVKTRYLSGSEFDPRGIVVTAEYSDGKVETVTDYTLDAPKGKLTADTSFSVSYGDKTATRAVRVVSGSGKSEAQIKSEFTANKSSHVYNGYTVNYVERKPDYAASASDPAPLVLFLHGAGERGNDNERQLKNSIAHAYDDISSMFYDAYVIAPQCPYRMTEDGEDLDDGSYMNMSYTKWVNRDWTLGNYNLSEISETKALATVANLVEKYADKPEIDASRVYVVGLSMGGYGTWDMLARHGELFAAGVPMCGGGPIDRATALADMPIYAFHGDKDGTVPYALCTPLMYEAVKAEGKNKMIFKTMAGQGHGIWDNVWRVGASDLDAEGNACPRVVDWLFEQCK